jgi:hypothetical protein
MYVKLLILVLIFFCKTTLAQLYIEPHIGIVEGKFYQDLKGITGTDTPRNKSYNNDDRTVKGKTGAFSFGSKIGYKLGFIFGALDLSYLTGTFYNIGITADRNLKGNRPHLFNYEEDILGSTNITSGFILGVDLPLVPRLWIGYNFYDYLILKDVVSVDELQGHGPRFGIGFGFGVLFSFNVEYSMTTFSRRDSKSLPTIIEEGGLSYQERGFETDKYLISISYLFSL